MPNLSDPPTPTIYDVAAALGMHKSTVSQGLSGKGTISVATRARILKMAQEMGYQPNPVAQRLAKSGDNKLVYLCAGSLDVGQATGKILLIQEQLKRRKLEVPIYSLSRFSGEIPLTQAQEIHNLCRQKPRAIVYSTQLWQPPILTELQRYQKSGGLLVCYDLPVPLACDQVVFDREDNAYQVARYLIKRGHTKLGFNLPGELQKPEKANRPEHHRFNGFCRALKEAGLSWHEEWIFKQSAYERGGAEMATQFLALQERPTGICIANDYVALAFMVEVMRAGVRIPQDLSVVGHNDEPVAAYCPVPLTSAVQPEEQIAQSVVQLLTERLDGNTDESRTITIRGELVERQSVATFVR